MAQQIFVFISNPQPILIYLDSLMQIGPLAYMIGNP